MALQWVEGAVLEVHEWIDLKVPTAAVDINSQILDNVADAAARDNAPNWGQVQDFVTLGREQVDSVKDRDLVDPPGSPTTGDRYIVGGTGINGWVGQDNDIAEWDGAAWQFQDTSEGLTCWVDDEDITVTWNGSAWVQSGGASYYTAAADSGIDITGLALSLDIAGLTADTAIAGTDRIPIYDGGNKYITFANFEGDLSHANIGDLTTGDPHTQYQLESEKNAANGYAPLDASSDVPNANISSGSVTQHEGDIDHNALTNFSDDQHEKILAGTTASRGTAAAFGVGYYWDTDNGTWHYSNGTAWQDIVATAASHASTHALGQSDEMNGDVLGIDWNPTYYTPATTPSEVTSVDELTAHLYGVDQELNGVQTHLGLTNNPHSTDVANLGQGTKAEFDGRISDGTVQWTGEAPTAHDLDAHTAVLLSALNAKITDATLDDASDPRDPTSHAYDTHSGTVPAADLAGFTKSELDTLVSDGNITYDGDAPTSHAYDTHSGTVPYTDLGGFTKAQLDVLVSDGNIVYDGDDLSGTYQAVSEKGAASGYPSLDGNSEVTEPILYFHSGVFASLPGAPTAVGQVYAAYDQGRIFFGMNF